MNPVQVACCPNDGNPLVLSFHVPKKEFHCTDCRAWWEFLQPVGQPETPELIARYEANCEKFKNECRHMTHVQACGPTGDDMYCACGCGGDDSYCGADFLDALMMLLWGKGWY